MSFRQTYSFFMYGRTSGVEGEADSRSHWPKRL